MHDQDSGTGARKATGNSGGARRAAGDQIAGGRSAGRGEGQETHIPTANPAPSPPKPPEPSSPSSFRRRPESSTREGLAIRGLGVSLGGKAILAGLDLSVRRGEILALLGPSGCGKTTLLRAVAGLLAPDAGHISWAGEDLRAIATHRRRFGMVFQDHALLPHRNVGANVAFGLRMQGVPAAERTRRVTEVLHMAGLGGYERRSVVTLSGGEAQRVALARALAPEPRLLLADEPFAALDRPLHDRLLGDVRRILSDLGQTAIHVTHDHTEAFALADRVALMRDGRIHRTATPQQLRADPQDAWTATFLGLGTVWHPGSGGLPEGTAGPIAGGGEVRGAAGSTRTGREIDTPWGPLSLEAVASGGRSATIPAAGTQARSGRPGAGAGETCLLIRPDAVGPGGPSGIGAVVSDVRVAGDRTMATFEVPGAPPLNGYAPANLTTGQRYRIALNPAGVILIRSGS